MKNKKLISLATMAIVFSLSTSFAFALGMTAGPVRILVDVGSSGSATYGLVNNGNETITVTLRVEGDAAQFLEIPTKLEIEPKKVEYVNVRATIPQNYDGSLGGNITGFIYAVQEGTPGQVQINVQAKKSLQLLIPTYGGKLPEAASQTQTQTQTPSGDLMTGFASLSAAGLTDPLVIAVIVVVIVIIVVFVLSRRFKIVAVPKKNKK